MIKAVIFDMDGVLIDSQPLHYLGDQQTLALRGVQVDISEMVQYAGTTNQLRFERFKTLYHLDEPVDVLVKSREEIMLRLIAKSNAAAVSGTESLLQDIKSHGVLTAVASSSSFEFIYAVLDKIRLRSYFDEIFSGEHVPHGKPAPDVFLQTAKSLGCTPEECVVIEDSHNGVMAAVNAGMRCLGYINPTSGEQDLSAADVTTDDFTKTDFEFINRI